MVFDMKFPIKTIVHSSIKTLISSMYMRLQD